MIKFFRRIRHKLLKENRLAQYLIYAIGEVILVMVGILLALQVNNWNQSRLDRQEEKAILINLKEDFKNAIEEFESLNGMRTAIISAAKDIMSVSVDDINNYPKNYLDSLFSRTLNGPTFNNKSGSLNVLLTSGKINLITNNALKNTLIEWPGDVDDMIEDEVNHDELYRGLYQEMLFNYISWNDMIKYYTNATVRFDKASLEILDENSIMSSDFKSLLSSKKFLNILQSRASFCMISNHETAVLIEKANGIIELINDDL